MRHSVLRTFSTVLLFFVFCLPASFLGQAQNSKKPSSNKRAVKETTLKADEGPWVKVKIPIRKDRRIPLAAGEQGQGDGKPAEMPAFRVLSHPREDRLMQGHSFDHDLRTLPQIPPEKFERPEFEEPKITPVPYPGTQANSLQSTTTATSPFAPSAPAPAPSNSFEGLDFTNWGAGHPPDTNGDVGPQYYIQTINTSVGIYNKSDGTRVTAFIFNTLMSQGSFGNLCDTGNFGDPVVVYDTFEDRWVITDFAFNLSGGNPVAPEFQCFAVSKSGDPVAGGWNFYSIQVNGGFGDYPKFGIWPDGLYMSANVFGFGAGGAFQNVRVWALNKAQMYAGAPTVQVLSFDAPSAEFTLLPSNARLQTGTPPTGSPNYFSVVAQFLNVVSVYKFHADWSNISTSTFSGPFQSLTATNWSQLLAANQTEQSPGNKLDTLYFRLMVQNQYTNIGGIESLWNSHTVGASGATSAQSAVRYYQVKVPGGTVEPNATQAFTYSPDATVFRFMPSVEVDHAGDMAIGYSATNATLNPAIRYAGRLAGDPVNSITQTEQSLIEGTGTQSGNCGASSCTRWGDYSAMTLDMDGCTFWYTNMYYQVTGLAFNTRIGAFSFPGCTPVATGTLQGTVTASGSGNPINGATVALGSRTTTTDVNGIYSFTGLPSGTYPSLIASFPGYNSGTVSSIVVNDGLTTTQDFSLTLAPTSGCLVDDTQTDFQGGVPTNCDLTSSPGDVTLLNAPSIDQQNTTVTNSGFGFNSTSWAGQTFKAGVTGQLTRVDVDLFCSGCTGTTPNITISIRATTGSPAVPTGADLATATITGFSSGAGGYFTANFSSPPTLTAGTTYAVIFRAVSNPSAGTYAYVCSCTSPNSNPYVNGQRVTSANSGSTWTADITSGGRDLGFKIFMQTGFTSSGTFVSSLKDANPAPNNTANWGTLSWVATTPVNTNIQFQIAASNSPAGPFNFVGPDGTAGTFFSNGDSLAQFNSFRYLKYQATFSSSDSTQTPTLNSVSVCFTNVPIVLPPSISKTFGAASVPLNGVTSLTFNIQNPNAGTALTGVSFTDNLPAGLVVASTPNLNNTCGGTPTAVGGSSSVSLSGGTLAASASCTVSVDVQGTTAGVKNNSVQVTSTEGGTGNTSNASLTVIAPPTISKAFNPTSVALNSNSTLSFTVTNPNTTSALSGVAFTDNLPAGLVVAATPNVTGSCGAGTITAVAGSGSISLSGGTLTASPAVGSTCNFSVDVTGTTAGSQSNTTGAITSTEGGTGATSNTAVLTVVAPPSIAKVFNPNTIALNATTSLTFTITNPAANTVALTGVAFTDTLPTGLTVANASATVCGGTLTTTNPTGIALTGATIAVNSQCQFSVTVTGAASGIYTNTTGNVTSTNGGTGNTASANLTVASPPTITKAFGAAQITMGGTTSLTFTINNPNTTLALTGVAFTDNLPAGLVVATPNGLSNTCGGAVTATAGSGSVSLAGGGLAATASCTISVNVQGTTAGVKSNTTGPISSNESGPGAASNTASITVIGPPTITKAFGAASVPLNGTTSLTFTIVNPNTTSALSGVAFTDNLPAGLVVAATPNVTGSCGAGTITATAGSGSISLSSGTLTASPAAGSTCNFSVDVTGTTAGSQSNTTGVITSTEGGTGATSNTAVLAVVASPSIAKVFNPAGIPLNGTTSLTFTITNPAANTVALTGVAFTDTLPTGLTVANASATVCGGTLTTTAPTGIALSGATININSQCQFSVTVTGTQAGQFTNVTGNVTSTNGGTGNTATANLTVATPPTITKFFSADNVALNGTVAVFFSITNPTVNPIPLTGVAFTDNLPAGLVVANPNGVSSDCGGTVTAVPGSGSITLANGTLAIDTTCTLIVNLKATTIGLKTNTTGPVSATESGPGTASNTASVEVVQPPALTKAFGAASITLGSTTSLTFTASNPNTTVSLVNVDFSDFLPAGLVIASPNAVSGTCVSNNGAAVTANPGSNGINATAFVLAPSSNCTVVVNVTATTTGTKNNTSGNITATFDDGTGTFVLITGGTASASITVTSLADLTITKTHVGNFAQAQTGAIYTITVSNVGTGPSGGTVTVTDTLPAGLTATAMSGTGWACNVATLTCTRSDVLANGASYPPITLTVNVFATAPASVTNTATVSGGSDTNPANNTAPDVTIVTQVFITITPGTSSATVKRGQSGTFTFTVNASVPGTIALLCSGLPQGATCSFNPATPASNGSTPETLTISTTAPPGLGMNQPQLPLGTEPIYVAMMTLPTFGLLFVGIRSDRRGKKGKALRLILVGVIILLGILMLAGCGGHPRNNGGGNNGNPTPPGTYNITVTATNGTVTAQTTVTLTVTP